MVLLAFIPLLVIISHCINISFSPRNLLQWGKHSYCFCLPVSLLLCNIFPSSVLLSPAFLKEVLGVLFYRSVHFLLIFSNYYIALPEKMGNEGGFPSHIFCTFSNELPYALLLPAPGKEMFGRSSNRKHTRSLFLWKQVEDGRKIGQGVKKKLTASRANYRVCTAAECFMAALPVLGYWTSVVCCKCSIRAVFNSAFCFAPVVLMKDTDGKRVIHVHGLLWSSQQWYSTRHHLCSSTSIISGWCRYLYWWHLITPPGRSTKESRLRWLNFPLGKH